MEIPFASSLAATGWDAQPGATKFFIGMLVLGIILTVTGVRRNENKKKAGLAVFGLLITVGSTIAALYVK